MPAPAHYLADRAKAEAKKELLAELGPRIAALEATVARLLAIIEAKYGRLT